MNVKSSTDVDDRSTRMEWNLEENSPVEVISYAVPKFKMGRGENENDYTGNKL